MSKQDICCCQILGYFGFFLFLSSLSQFSFSPWPSPFNCHFHFSPSLSFLFPLSSLSSMKGKHFIAWEQDRYFIKQYHKIGYDFTIARNFILTELCFLYHEKSDAVAQLGQQTPVKSQQERIHFLFLFLGKAGHACFQKYLSWH